MSEPAEPPAGAPPPGMPGPPGPAVPAGAGRRRTHRLTPVVSSFRAAGVIAVALVAMGSDVVGSIAAQLGALPALLVTVTALALLLGLVAGLQYVVWTRTVFFFDGAGDFRLDSGVLQRKERRLALSRLQAVDIVRPLLGRVVGLSQLRIEVAGGGDSHIVLSYLGDADAQALRAEIIARAAGVAPDAGEAPERVLATVPTRDLIVSLLLRSETILLALLTLAIVASMVATEGAGGLLVLLVTGGIPLLSVFTQFSRFFGFTVADSPDGLRLRHGLVSVSSQTVPPGRVQAVELAQPLLWRRRGWVRVSMNVAGIHGTEDESRVEHVLLPVAPREVAESILARVLPGVDLSGLALEAAPAAARRRAWLQWRSLAVGHDERVLAARRGFLTRTLSVVPHARTQSVQVTQGPWQRRLGLASVHVDSTPGPVVVVGLHRLAADARRIAEEQLVRAGAARRSGHSERWMVPDPPVADSPLSAP